MKTIFDKFCTEKIVDVTVIPATHTHTLNKHTGAFYVIFGLLVAGILGHILVIGVLSGDFEAWMLYLLIPVSFGVAMFLSGIFALTYKSTIHIDSNQVSVDTSSVFGKKRWSELLSKYKGIITRSELRYGHSYNSSRMYYIIEMLHDDPTKCLILYYSTSDYHLRSTWEDYCRKLNMKAIEGKGENTIVREAADLDKSVYELATEGKLDIKFDPTQQPPEGIKVSMAGEVLKIKLPNNPTRIVPTIIGLMLTGFIMVLTFFFDNIHFFVTFSGFFFFFGILACAIMSRVSNTVLTIDNNDVKKWQKTPWGDWFKESININQIETVRVGKDPENTPFDSLACDAVLLISDNKAIKIAHEMSESSLIWLRDLILAATTQ